MKNELAIINDIPEEIKNIIFTHVPLSDWADFGYTSKQNYVLVKTLSQKWIKEFFPYIIQSHAHLFKHNPLKLLHRQFDYFSRYYRPISMPMFHAALTGHMDIITKSEDKLALYSIALANNKLPDNIIQILSQHDSRNIENNAFCNAAAIGNLEAINSAAKDSFLRKNALTKAIIYRHREVVQKLLSSETLRYNIEAALNIATKENQLDVAIDIYAKLQQRLSADEIKRTIEDFVLPTAASHGSTKILAHFLKDETLNADNFLSNCIRLRDKTIDSVKLLLRRRKITEKTKKEALLKAKKQKPPAPKIAALLQKDLNRKSYLNHAFIKTNKAIKIGFSLTLAILFYLSLPCATQVITAGTALLIATVSYKYIGNVMNAFFGKTKLLLKRRQLTSKSTEPHRFVIYAKFTLSLIIALSLSYFIFSTFTLSLSMLLSAATLTLANTLFLSQFIPINTVQKDVEIAKEWIIEYSEEKCSLLNLLGFYYPYQTSVKELEKNIYQQFKEALANTAEQEFDQMTAAEYKTQLTPLSKLFTKKIVTENSFAFYANACHEIADPAFNVNEQDSQMKKAIQLLIK
ncbi:MAG: hypothetical protein JSS07_10680 [Proteobacteria bacterium]|nr:hypothetical protein [Pseudomonadota bacterium]